MWLSVKRPPLSETKKLPYKGLNPVTGENVIIEDESQIHRILMECYEEAVERGFDIGEALYNQLFFLQTHILYMMKIVKT